MTETTDLIELMKSTFMRAMVAEATDSDPDAYIAWVGAFDADDKATWATETDWLATTLLCAWKMYEADANNQADGTSEDGPGDMSDFPAFAQWLDDAIEQSAVEAMAHGIENASPVDVFFADAFTIAKFVYESTGTTWSAGRWVP